MNSWILYLLLYLIFAVIFNQSYKIITNKMNNPGSLTILLEIIAGLFSLLLVPFCKFSFPNKISTYLLLVAACIFYAIQDCLSTKSRSGLETSSYIIIRQLSTVFMTIMGIVLFKEPLIITKIIGTSIIVISNIIIIYQKGAIKFDKYVKSGIIANLCMAFALLLDVNISSQFNLPMYVFLIVFIPSIMIKICNKIKIKTIVKEFKNNNKTLLIINGISWSLMLISRIKAYELGSITTIAPFCSLTVIINVIVGYILLKERSNLFKKIIAGLLIILGIILIQIK